MLAPAHKSSMQVYGAPNGTVAGRNGERREKKKTGRKKRLERMKRKEKLVGVDGYLCVA